MFETKWGHYWFLDVGCILCQTLVFCFFWFFVFWVFWFIVFLVYWFFGFLVFPLNWDRLGSHKIDQKIAQNLNFGEDFARNHCKTQCFCIIFLHEKHLPGGPVLEGKTSPRRTRSEKNRSLRSMWTRRLPSKLLVAVLRGHKDLLGVCATSEGFGTQVAPCETEPGHRLLGRPTGVERGKVRGEASAWWKVGLQILSFRRRLGWV